MTPHDVLAALDTLRAPRTQDEYDLHSLVREALERHDISYVHEAALASRSRIDYLCGDIGIEIKRGRPEKTPLIRQLMRYAQSGRLSAVILIAERLPPLPKEVSGVPVYTVSLQKLWGVATAALGARETASQQPALPPRAIPAPSQAFDNAIENLVLDDILNGDLPDYLIARPPKGHIYGTLSYNQRRRHWVIKGEACVTEMAKRLFPSSAVSRRGEAHFVAHRRIIGDVNWLMMRYPLTIAERDRKKWQEALLSAQDYARQRERARTAPTLIEPPADAFAGTLRPFQQAGLGFLLMTPRALLADEMGLGKTVQALACVAIQQLCPLMIIVPPHLMRNWQSEVSRFLRKDGAPPRIHVLKGLTPYPLPDADVYIMHYLLLRGWKQALREMDFRAIIFDEIQELRHAGTEKYSAASLLSENCEHVIGLSGTPIYNHGGEIWNVVNILDYHFLGDWESFTREWCYGYGNNIVYKPDQLGEHLRHEGLMLRRTKQDVLPELPEKRRLVQEIDADDAIYQKLMRPVQEKLSLWRSSDAMTASERALLEDQISQGARQATGVAKAPYVAQFVRALLESGEKVLLFAHHHAVMDIYHDDLKAFRPAFITGRETGAQKESAVERFMTGKTELCCISLRAASGLNLQRASCVVFGELDWSPAVHSQAEDRAHRIGQTDSLLCYYLVSPRGSDADMQEALGLKVSQFVALMGDAPESPDHARASASLARRHVENMIQQEEKSQISSKSPL